MSRGDQAKSGLGPNQLRARRFGLDSQHDALVLMHKDCAVCRSEGFEALTRLELRAGAHTALATLYQVDGDVLALDEAGLSEAAWRRLKAYEGQAISVAHAPTLQSLGAVRAKLYGKRLDAAELHAIIADIVGERYSDIELAAFVAAFSSRPFALVETAALTRAMVAAGDRLAWASPVVADKHSVGGLPGNRTSPIVVAIAAAAGLVVPKTSSRAITSPAGTADVMETMTCVDLDLRAMRAVVEREGGCLVWGGSVRLSPADDLIIRVERALDVDCESQLVASVLSKKIAAGATHVLLDMPVGPSAKVRSPAQAQALCNHLVAVGKRFGLIVQPSLSDGIQPVGRGIGPALEARDVLKVLRGEPDAPADLRARSLTLAAALLVLAGGLSEAEARVRAEAILASGAALAKFLAICDAQGGFREPPLPRLTTLVTASGRGRVTQLDNRLLARTAKLAGAPGAKAAGLEMHVKLGDAVDPGAPLFTVHAESDGELAYALAFARANAGMITVAR